MITEEEFRRGVLSVASIEESLTIEEFNASVLELASRLTIARSARNRARLFSIQDEMEVRRDHATGMHCGRASCPRCNGRDVE